MREDKWVKRWRVAGSENIWTVAQDRDGNWGCSCPVWRFRRKECPHILQVKKERVLQELEPKPKPIYKLAKVLKPEYKKETNELLIPLITPGDIKMQATICHALLIHGYSMGEIKKIRNIPRDWTKEKIINYIKTYGEAEYPEGWYTGRWGR